MHFNKVFLFVRPCVNHDNRSRPLLLYSVTPASVPHSACCEINPEQLHPCQCRLDAYTYSKWRHYDVSRPHHLLRCARQNCFLILSKTATSIATCYRSDEFWQTAVKLVISGDFVENQETTEKTCLFVCSKISRNKRKRQPIGMLGRSSGNHDWLLANASACVSCGFRLRNARNASDCVWMETWL